jgi:hypothetical protein
LTADLTIRPVSETRTAEASPLAARVPYVRKTADPAQKFEAFVLQTFIQEMMPETPESVFGAGISGDFWKSMMAEKIAEQVAARGSLGIADYLRAGHEPPVRVGGFNPLDVTTHLSPLNGAADLLDAKLVSGE